MYKIDVTYNRMYLWSSHSHEYIYIIVYNRDSIEDIKHKA